MVASQTAQGAWFNRPDGSGLVQARCRAGSIGAKGAELTFTLFTADIFESAIGADAVSKALTPAQLCDDCAPPMFRTIRAKGRSVCQYAPCQLFLAPHLRADCAPIAL
jgi:hypothetical protein